MADGRVLIAFNDGPLAPSPTWTRIDDLHAGLVAGYDMTRGRQTLLDRTDTGTATLYLNDRWGIFDAQNASSDYYGLLDGKQILFQIYDPTTATWEPHWRGVIDEWGYDLNPATDQNGDLLLANIQVDCVDIFDYLSGYGLTPGLDGVTPPGGSEGTIWYAETAGEVDDRMIKVLADADVDPTMYVVFTGNVRLQEANYDADESALTVLRDCADADMPGIANVYPDRYGRFVFHGRYSRIDPDTISASATDWDFQRWAVGDGKAIAADSTRAQMRVLSYLRSRANIINAALAYPKGIAEADIPGQAYVDATSITAYGKHALPPMSDLLIKEGVTTGNDANTETALYAQFRVKNQKDPVEAIQTLTLKAIGPDDARAAATWPVITRADISDIVNVSVGFPAGTGIQDTDYYLEGSETRVRPLNLDHDYVERDLNISPAVWSQDTHNVFPALS